MHQPAQEPHCPDCGSSSVLVGEIELGPMVQDASEHNGMALIAATPMSCGSCGADWVEKIFHSMIPAGSA